jgi:hypothetical protein
MPMSRLSKLLAASSKIMILTSCSLYLGLELYSHHMGWCRMNFLSI